jgi:hypothetical protein
MQPSTKTAAMAAVAELGEAAMAMAGPETQPAEYVSLLLGKKLYPDAVRFVAHALPKREGIWWAWMCARRAAGEQAKPEIRAALEATEKWIAQPNEEHRRAAMAAAEKAQFDTPAGCAGLAAFLTSGSMAPPEAPPVPPGEYLSAKAVSGAVICAAVTEPENAPARFEQFVAQGLDVANRIKLWEAKQ